MADSIGYYKALLNKDLLHYLYNDLKKTKIDVYTFLVYERSLLTQLNVSSVYAILKMLYFEKDINCTSLVFDQWIVESHCQRMQSCNHVTISEMCSLRTTPQTRSCHHHHYHHHLERSPFVALYTDIAIFSVDYYHQGQKS